MPISANKIQVPYMQTKHYGGKDMSKKMENLLVDECVIKYLLRNEELIGECFDLPNDESPSEFLIKLSNEECLLEMEKGAPLKKNMKYKQYEQHSLYTSILRSCSFCNATLNVKKSIKMFLYDDVFGTTKIIVLTKFCKQARIYRVGELVKS